MLFLWPWPWFCFLFQAQVRRRTVQWWNQVKVGWSLTATGRGRKRSSEEAQCHWERNSPQVHLTIAWSCSFYIRWSKPVIFHIQKYSPRILYLCIMMKHISLSTNVWLTQQFRSIHHIPPGSSSQMDLNGHTKSPVRSLIAMLFLQGITLCSQSISQKHELS